MAWCSTPCDTIWVHASAAKVLDSPEIHRLLTPDLIEVSSPEAEPDPTPAVAAHGPTNDPAPTTTLGPSDSALGSLNQGPGVQPDGAIPCEPIAGNQWRDVPPQHLVTRCPRHNEPLLWHIFMTGARRGQPHMCLVWRGFGRHCQIARLDFRLRGVRSVPRICPRWHVRSGTDRDCWFDRPAKPDEAPPDARA